MEIIVVIIALAIVILYVEISMSRMQINLKKQAEEIQENILDEFAIINAEMNLISHECKNIYTCQFYKHD